MKRISQREARRLRKRVAELEDLENQRRRTWIQEWPGGVNIISATYANGTEQVPVAIRTARKLGHAVVVLGDDTGNLRFVALPLAEPKR